ncbi:MAG TPA: hypothetical protein VFG69_18310 [Nannocystaceae bacterium]|nr:hypothetical protein [Nannocystaceae bacterium]
MRRRALVPVFLLCVPACNGDATNVVADDGASSDDGADETGEPQSEGESTGAIETGEGSTSTTGGAAFEPIPARGIVVSSIEANQGVGVPIFANGTWVPAGSRNAELVKDRNMLVRAFWEIEPDFVPREIEARIDLHLPDGSIESAAKTVLVEGPSDPADLDQSFWWGLPQEMLVPGVEFQITLWETDFGQEGTPEPSPLPAFPASPEPIGLEDSELALRVMLVPVHHDLGPQCAEPPLIDQIAIDIFRDHLYVQNPVHEVEITGHPGIVWTDDLHSFGGLLGELAQLHADVDPGMYVYGVVRPCDGGPQDVGGQAIDIPGPPSTGNSWSRTAVGRWYSSNLGQTAETFVHEIGHTQGRYHVACNGQEGGTTPLYPYAGGVIGVWGFDILAFDQLHKPDIAKDYMTYCGNTWVSDWGWHEVFPYVREITSWDVMDAQPPDSELLVGLVDPTSGDETWIRTKGTATGRVPGFTESVELVDADGIAHELPATIGSMGEHGGYNVVVALPDGIDAKTASSLTRISAGVRRPFALAN